MCDQEGALKTMVQEALETCKRRGAWIPAVPEHSPVGESQSNGLSERSVQRFENQLRKFLAELELRIGRQIASTQPIVSWLVEYTAIVLNKHHVNEAANETAYYSLHGKDASEKLAYFGEKVFFHISARRRANLDLRWSSGVCLVTTMISTEALIGVPNGDVTRTSSISRLIPSQRWSADAVLDVSGVPAKPTAHD